MARRVKQTLNCRQCGKDISDMKYKVMYCGDGCRREYRAKYKRYWARKNRKRLTQQMREYRIRQRLKARQIEIDNQI